LLGPQGTGGLYVREDIRLKPIMEGGTGSNSEYAFQPEIMPDLLESGTLNTPGIVGLCSGIRYIENRGVKEIRQYKHSLVKRLIEGIRDIKSLKLYSLEDCSRNSGILAMNLGNLDSTEFCYILDKEYGIEARAGLHCAPSAHRRLGTMKRGIVRLSVGCFNNMEEIDYTIESIIRISKSFPKS